MSDKSVHSARAWRAGALVVAVALAGVALLARQRRGAAGGLTLATITVDGDPSDWSAVLANSGQTSHDGDGSSYTSTQCAQFSTDRDCPVGGGAGNDLLTFAWTYDPSYVYVYIERYGSNSNGVDFFFLADVNGDQKIDAANDKVIHASWAGATGSVSLETCTYNPATPGGDAIANPTTGYVDGYNMPGSVTCSGSCAASGGNTCLGRGATTGALAGEAMELRVPWQDFGLTGQQPFYWHVASSNNASLAKVVDNIGGPNGKLGSFFYRAVALTPNGSAGVTSPGSVTYAHVIQNTGNAADTFDLAATSTQGAQLELLDGATVAAVDSNGDGAWDSITAGYDSNGDGRPDFGALASGAAKSFALRITMPAGRGGSDTTRLTAVSAGDPTVSATATDTSVIGAVAMLPASAVRGATAGAQVPFAETVAYNGASADTLDFTLQNQAGCTWRADLLTDNAGVPGTVFATDLTGDGVWDSIAPGYDSNADGKPDLGAVAGGTSEKVWLRLTVPGGASNGATCAAALTATAAASGLHGSATDSVTVGPALAFTPSYTVAAGTNRIVTSGDLVYFPGALQNDEGVPRSYTFSASLAASPALPGPALPVKIWTDPDGNGNPSDGCLLGSAGCPSTPSVGAFGGTANVIVELDASYLAGATQTADPTQTILTALVAATATSGGATATQDDEAKVGYLSAFRDALLTQSARAFAPCDTVYLHADNLAAADVTSYTLTVKDALGATVLTVSPWGTTARGTADASLVIGAAGAAGTWTATLADNGTGGGKTDTLDFAVERSGAFTSLGTDKAVYLANDPLAVNATVKNTNTSAPLVNSALRYVVEDQSGTTSMTLAGSFVTPAGTTRTLGSQTVPAGNALSDGFAVGSAAFPAPGHYQVYAQWQLACGATPLVTSATSSFDVAPPAPAVTAPTAGSTLNTRTPAISGTALAGASVAVSVDGALAGTVVASGAGAWSYTLGGAQQLADGAHSATAAQTVNGVQSAPSAADGFNVDATPPAAPVVTAPSGGLVTSASSLVVSGNDGGDASAVQAELLDNGVVVSGPAAISAGAFSFTETNPPRLAAGAHLYTVRSLDAAGNVSPDSNAVSVTIDRTPPAAPAITTPAANPFYTNVATVTVGGTAEASSTVAIYDGATLLGTTPASGSGAWSRAFTLSDGSHVVSATATDAAGNVSSGSGSVTVVVDTVAPAAPAITSPVTGSSLSVTALTLTGTAEAFATVKVYDGGALIALATADGSGNWSVVYDNGGTQAPEKTYSLTATATDPAGNTGPASSPAVSATVDRTAPAAPVFTYPAGGSTINDSNPVSVKGGAEAGALVTLMEGATTLGTATATGGAWTIAATLASGAHTLTATAKDAANNVSSPATLSFTIDRTTPATPVFAHPLDGMVLNDANPVSVSGTASAANVVAVTEGATTIGTATADLSGNWSFTATIAAGTHTYSAQAHNLALVYSGTATLTFTVDRTPPAPPVIAWPANGGFVSSPNPVPVRGTGEFGDTVTLSEAGVSLGTAVVDGAGDWVVNATFAGGGHTILAVQRDAAGNTSNPSLGVTFTVDRAPPAAPVITSPANGAVLATSVVSVGGSAEAGSTVRTYADGILAATVTADGAGSFAATLSLAGGNHVLTATATDAAGNLSPTSQPVAVAIDLAYPTAPVIASPANGSYSTSTTVTVAGAADASVEVDLYDQAGGIQIGTTTSDGAGAWSMPGLAFAEGSHTLEAVAVKSISGTPRTSPPSPAVTFTVDVTPPAAPIIANPAEGAVVATATPSITGSAEPGSTVRVYVDDFATPAGTVPADASTGYFSYTLTAGQALAPGAHAARADATDPAGNGSPQTADRNFTVDTALALAPPVITSPADGTLTNAATVAVTGTSQPGATVVVYENGTAVATLTADGAGNWSLASLTLLQQANELTATQAVGAATSPASNVVTVFRDSTPPSPPVITQPPNGTLTPFSSVPVAGDAEANSTVRLYDGASPLAPTVTASLAAHFTGALTLAEGTHLLSADATDAAGNTSAQGPAVSVTVDLTPPAAPAFTSPARGTVTNADPVALAGTAEAGATVRLFANGVFVTATLASPGGAFGFSLPGVPDGAYAYTADATDGAGNVGPQSAALDVTVDRTPPAAPVVSSPADGAITNAASFAVSGTAEAGSTVILDDGASVVGTTTATGGAWSVTVSPAEGAHVYTASATDAATNVSPASAAVHVTVDRTPPAAPVLSAPADNTVTNAAGYPVSGTAENGSTVTLYDGATAVGTATASASDGSFAVALTPAEGAHVYTATATDAANNVSTASNALHVTVDRTPPAAPVLLAPADGSSTNAASFAVSGSAEPNSTVTLYDGAAAVGTAIAAGGSWSVGVSPAEGAHAYTATATDAAANVSPPSAPTHVLVDRTPPAAPLIASPADGAVLNAAAAPGGTFAASGTAEANATVTVLASGSVAGTAAADASGNWSATVTLADGAWTLRASATDAAGNTGAQTTPGNAIQLDTTPPGVPAITAPAGGTATNAASIAVGGLTDPGTTVELRLDGVLAATLAADAAGAWSAMVALPGADGTVLFDARAQDAAGNFSAYSAAASVIVDRTPPAAPVIASPAGGALVNTPNTTVSGSAEAGALVAVTLDGDATTTQTVTATGGAWAAAFATPDGAHAVSATAQDAAGNVSPAATSGFTVDATPPAAPVISDPADGTVTPHAQPTVSGTAEAGAQVAVLLDGAPYATAMAGASGAFAAAPTTAALTQGVQQTFTATATDAAGNTSAPSAGVRVTYDPTAVAVPAITSPVDQAVVANAGAGVSGTGDPGDSVTVFVDGTTTPYGAAATVDASGNWSVAAASTLTDGAHTFAAQSTSPLGNPSSVSGLVHVTVDTQAPVVDAPAAGSVTNAAPVPLAGHGCHPGWTAEVTLDGATPALVFTCDAQGLFSGALGVPADGLHDLSALDRDAQGVATASTSLQFTVDRTPPTPPAIASPADGALTNNPSVTLAGAAEAGSSVQAFDGASAAGAPVTATSGGAFSIALAGLADGAHPFTVVATDGAGNASAASNTVTVTVDTQKPAIAFTFPTEGLLTNAAAITATGTGEAGCSVGLTLDGNPAGATTADGSGAWSYGLGAVPETPAPHLLAAHCTDAAGNKSADQSVHFTVDRTAPPPPVIAAPADQAPVTSLPLDVSGTAEAGAAVAVYVDGGATPACAATAGGAGAWTCAIAALADGTRALAATATDAAGNTSAPSGAIHVVVGVQPPGAPAITSPADGAKLVASAVPVQGTADPGLPVHLFVGGADTATAQADGAGAWAGTLTLADGCYVLTARSQNAAGLPGPFSAPVNACIDTVPPAQPTIESPADGAVTGQTGFDVRVALATPDPTATVTLAVDGAPQTPVSEGTTGSGVYTVTLSGLSDGAHALVAVATDDFGNASAPSATVTVTVDTTPPLAPTITKPADGLLTNAPSPFTVEGSAQEGDVAVDVDVDGTIAAAGVLADATGHFATGLDLAEGSHQLRARATDKAGNVGPWSAVVGVTVDRTPPAVPVITAPAEGATVHDGALDLTATLANDTQKLTLAVDGVGADYATAGVTAFTKALSLQEGDHTVTAVATDRAGNASAPAAVRFHVDLGELRGGGCGCGHGTPSAPFFALILFALVRLRRRRPSPRPVLVALALALPLGARAGGFLEGGMDVERFHPASDASGGFALESPDALPRYQLTTALFTDYGSAPLVWTDHHGATIAKLVSARSTIGAQGTVGLGFAQFSATVPLAIQSGALPAPNGGTAGLAPVAMSDARLGLKVPVPADLGGLRLAALVGGVLPTGSDRALTGGDPGLDVGAAGAMQAGPVLVGANLGVLWRPAVQLRPNFEMGSELAYRAGVAWAFPAATALAELDGGTLLNGQAGGTSLELLAGARVPAAIPGLAFDLAAGAGVLNGFGTPAWRAIVGVRYTPEGSARVKGTRAPPSDLPALSPAAPARRSPPVAAPTPTPAPIHTEVPLPPPPDTSKARVKHVAPAGPAGAPRAHTDVPLPPPPPGTEPVTPLVLPPPPKKNGAHGPAAPSRAIAPGDAAPQVPLDLPPPPVRKKGKAPGKKKPAAEKAK